MQTDLKNIIENADSELYKIELSILYKDENGENIDTTVVAEIYT